MRNDRQNLFSPPTDAVFRVTAMPAGGHERWAVLIARGESPRFENLLRPGGLAALLTHDQGLCWPDAAGEELMAATLDRGGMVLMAFVTLADALGCMNRLEQAREGGR
jgi:hypothetical protein